MYVCVIECVFVCVVCVSETEREIGHLPINTVNGFPTLYSSCLFMSVRIKGTKWQLAD